MKFKIITASIFFGVLIIFSLATFLLPKRERSELENRSLQEAPKLSVDSILSKKFMTDAEKYMADHLPLRDALGMAKTQIELSTGKRELNSVFIGEDMLLENIPEPDIKYSKDNMEAISKFANKYADTLETQVMLIPTALPFYPEQVSELAPSVDQAAYIKECYSMLSGATAVDAYSAMSSSAGEYIYYRTDHHWTSQGAYQGYAALAKALGFKPAAISEFNIEHASHDFLGTLYSKVLCGENLADTIDLYHYAESDVISEVIRSTQSGEEKSKSIFFKENLEKKDKYSVFLSTNTDVVRVKTTVKNGKRLLLFKDSYSHALMQFLPLHYEEIVLVDLRYLNKPIEEYINLEDYNQALFIYNVAGFSQDKTVAKAATF